MIKTKWFSDMLDIRIESRLKGDVDNALSTLNESIIKDEIGCNLIEENFERYKEALRFLDEYHNIKKLNEDIINGKGEQAPIIRSGLYKEEYNNGR